MTDVARLIPPHEKRILEAHVRKVPLNRLAFAILENPLNEYEERELKNLVRMRMQGLPLQYLTGSQAFYGREFYVNTGVLIPRPETEGLVELVLKNLPPPLEGRRSYAIELGTGSGCIALTLALERPDLRIYASECSATALSVAEENARNLRVANAEFFQVSETPQLWQYNDMPEVGLLISNPPYLVLSDEIAQDVREHEPSEALFAPDEDPLLFYRFLADLADAKLNSNGLAAFEIAEQRGPDVVALFTERGYNTKIFKDLTDRDRYVLACRKEASLNG